MSAPQGNEVPQKHAAIQHFFIYKDIHGSLFSSMLNNRWFVFLLRQWALLFNGGRLLYKNAYTL
jgi:hypothetical protein